MSIGLVYNFAVDPHYLAGVPPLPDELLAKLDAKELSPADAVRAAQLINILKRLVRHARSIYERQTGIIIDPEPPPDGC